MHTQHETAFSVDHMLRALGVFCGRIIKCQTLADNVHKSNQNTHAQFWHHSKKAENAKTRLLAYECIQKYSSLKQLIKIKGVQSLKNGSSLKIQFNECSAI